MARKSKADSSAEFATWIEEDLPTLADTALPAHRSRKPKLAESAAGPLATMDGDDPIVTPMRKRAGPKPKQRPASAAAAPVQKEAKAKPGQKADAPAAVPKPASAEDHMLATGLTGEHDEGSVQEAASLETTVDTAAGGFASPLHNQDTAASAQPAARWDRAADTVQFDWPEIERTAAQEGPDQIMAKLLVAARAEGANSRWPL